MSSTTLDLLPAIPALILAATALIVLLAQAFAPKGQGVPGAWFSLAGLLASLASVVLLARRGGGDLGGSYVVDEFSLFLHAVILCVGILAVLLSRGYLRATGIDRGEYYTLLLFSLVGMLGLVSCRELVSLFVALEVMSVALYALCGLHRDRPESQEASLKYFITGAFSSGFLLYGIALLYGASGSTSLPLVAQALRTADASTAMLALLGAGLILVGFGFKVASVPFHMWAPDVYEGAPTTVTALMSAGVKAAAFGALLRVAVQGLPALADRWQPAVAALAIVSMLIGNLGALAQSNLKRMLAYSSVAHAGYLLSALVAAPGLGIEAVLFYLVGYAAVNLGGFGAIAALTREGREPLSLADVSGLAARRPALAAALTVYLISLTGVPVSAGFVGKFFLFRSAVDAGWVSLAIVGFLTSVVSAYYYLRVVVAMYMREPVGEDSWAPVAPSAAVALGLSAAVVVVLGVYPGPVLAWARVAARSLL